MERNRYLELLAQDGERLREVAARDVSAPVPSCPGWSVADLVRHIAEVYEHKLACVALGGARPDPWPPVWPAADDPLPWFDDALQRLLAMLRETDPDAASWTWWPADQTAGFWVRRMAQETAVHRVDVELATGDASAIDAELAVDGIEELLDLMFAGDWTGDEQPTLTGIVAVSTAGRTWTAVMAEDQVTVSAGDGISPEAEVTGEPSPLLLWMYGRAPDDVVSITGDRAAAIRLRQRLAIATR